MNTKRTSSACVESSVSSSKNSRKTQNTSRLPDPFPAPSLAAASHRPTVVTFTAPPAAARPRPPPPSPQPSSSFWPFWGSRKSSGVSEMELTYDESCIMSLSTHEFLFDVSSDQSNYDKGKPLHWGQAVPERDCKRPSGF